MIYSICMAMCLIPSHCSYAGSPMGPYAPFPTSWLPLTVHHCTTTVRGSNWLGESSFINQRSKHFSNVFYVSDGFTFLVCFITIRLSKDDFRLWYYIKAVVAVRALKLENYSYCDNLSNKLSLSRIFFSPQVLSAELAQRYIWESGQP
jgi:hypothetical protein